MSGIAGFVDGVFKGMDWREARDDRKRTRKMNDEIHGWNRERQDWARQNQDIAVQDHDYTVSERERLRKEREAELSAWNETVDQMKGVAPQQAEGNTDAPSKAPQPADTTRPSTDSMPERNSPRAEDYAVGVPVEELRAMASKTAPDGFSLGSLGSGISEQKTPAQTQVPQNQSQAMSPQAPANPREMSINEAVQAIGPDIKGYGPGHVDPRLADAAGLFPRTPMPAPQKAMSIKDQFSPEELAQLQSNGQPGSFISQLPADAATARQPQPAAPQEQRQPLSVRDVDPNAPAFSQDYQRQGRVGDIERALYGIADDLNYGRDGGKASNPIARGAGAVTDYFTETPEQGDANAAMRSGRAEASKWYRSDEAKAFFSKTPDALNAAQQDPVRFYAALQNGPQPASSDAVATPASSQAKAAPAPEQAAPAPLAPQRNLSFGVVGKDGPVKTTKARVERAATAGQKLFNDKEMPAIVEHYLRTGQLEKATAFQEWSRQKNVQNGIKSYMAAAHALSIGDEMGAEKALRDVYNNQDYLDDGYSVPDGGVNIITDRDGNVSGAKITLKNNKTGQTYSQTVDEREFMLMAYRYLDPVSVFETSINAITSAESEAAKARLKSATAMNFDDAVGIVTDAIKAANDGVLNPDDFQKYTVEQILTIAQLLKANPNLNPVTLMKAIGAQGQADPTGGFRRQ